MRRLAAFASLTTAALSLLAGCSSGLNSAAFQSTLPQGPGPHLRGSVYGGQQPIAGATVQLYAAGATGNASAATPLIPRTILTDANGEFDLTGTYSCAGDPMIYLVALSGDPNQGSGGVNNAFIAQMAALGDCVTLQANAANIFINLNELTTAASVYALGGFLTDYDHVGYASNNRTGFANAIATFNALVNIASGQPQPTAPSGITLPSLKLVSLANSISACVNSSGSASEQCTTLASAATPSGGTAPTNEVAALANLAHNPSLGGTALFNLSLTSPPFAPALASAPADWTLAIQYTGGGLSLPNGIALDASGNAWIANEGSNAVTEISSVSFASGANGYTSSAIAGAQGIAIDASGNIWLANTQANNVLELNASGSIVNTLTTGINGPVAIASDLSGNLWVANFNGNSLAEFTASGSAVSGSPFTNTALVAPTGLTVDTGNNIWAGSSIPGTLAVFNNAGVFQSAYTDGFLVAPGGLAFDTSTNHLWTAATGIDGLTALAVTPSAGTAAALTGSPFAAATIAQPLAVAVDSSGTVWTAGNTNPGSLFAFDSSGNPLITNLGSLNQPVNLAVDASGNLWTTGSGDSSVTEFLGLAAPTLTPLVANLAAATGSVAPTHTGRR